jgi:Rps23 Pro-64 3,4-dihydroxylase Tpa1-like proline 4-hydroxylase
LAKKELQMNISETIKIYDDVVRPGILDGLYQHCKSKDFERAQVIGGMQGDALTKVRNTELFNFNSFRLYEYSMNDKIFTDLHWKNILHNVVASCNQKYIQDLKLPNKQLSVVDQLTILRYKVGGHYVLHTDYHTSQQREFSFILFVNDDFEGGDLTFADPNFKNERVIKAKKNRIVFFPSNFMFPHKVNPVTKGTRFSVVAWLK